MKRALLFLKDSWMKFAKLFGKANTAVLLAIIYIFVIGLIAIIARLFRFDKSTKNSVGAKSFWKSKPEDSKNIEQSKYQF